MKDNLEKIINDAKEEIEKKLQNLLDTYNGGNAQISENEKEIIHNLLKSINLSITQAYNQGKEDRDNELRTILNIEGVNEGTKIILSLIKKD